ncbi:hypothetical protein [Pedosphaera parvula]|uniref:Uncharacterized protein n=1 Tax=Pedosphaera parvula (strain Ellin514) TaxID=320771 RepID=B9XA17_PEDPL|nr:hypothetical protein [Pedosphaera parvula]EEF63358.1 hypothetical protein Cflav_PD5993 [Pedosphaera parvula Ellin514]
MLSFFKRSISAADLALVMWEGTRDWPTKHGSDLKDTFEGSCELSIEEVFEEFVYFLAFSTDYALWCQLKESPAIQSAVRDAFAVHVEQFAKQRNCRPVPSGAWMDDSLIWIPGETTDAGHPLTNLRRRFDLYAQSLSRRHDRSAGERTAHLLAAWCGTLDITFILCVTPLFLGRWNGIQAILGSFKIKP